MLKMRMKSSLLCSKTGIRLQSQLFRACRIHRDGDSFARRLGGDSLGRRCQHHQETDSRFVFIVFCYGKLRLKIMRSFSLLGYLSHWVLSLQGFNEASSRSRSCGSPIPSFVFFISSYFVIGIVSLLFGGLKYNM